MADFDRFSLFNEARERLGAALVSALADALPEIAQALELKAAGVGVSGERSALLAAASTLRLEWTGRGQRALGCFYDLTFRVLQTHRSGLDPQEGPLLALLEDHQLDQQWLADALAAAVREVLGGVHADLVSRVESLTQCAVGEMRGPLGAGVLATAAVEALRPVGGDAAVSHAFRAAALDRLVPRLAGAMSELDRWLSERGVDLAGATQPMPTALATPSPRAAVASEPSKPSAAPAPDPWHPTTELAAPVVATDPDPVAPAEPPPLASMDTSAKGVPSVGDEDGAMERAAESLLHATEVADVLGRQPVAVERSESAYRHAGLLPRPESLDRDALAFAHRIGVTPYTRAARQRWFELLRQRMLAATVPPAQLAALDLVAALFDYVVDDGRMPAAAQPLLWRLQYPAVLLAALDAGFLGDDRRSVRRLVENLAAISVAYADEVVQGSELQRRLETVVRAVEIVAHAFQSRSTVLGAQVRKEYARAAQGVTQLVSRISKERHSLEATPGRRNRRDYSRRPSREREQEVTRRIEAQLLERLSGLDVPESARDFLMGVWLRTLRTAVLRDGDESASYQLALQVVDDLLWSLDPVARQSRRQLATRIPPLIRLLTQGVTDIGAKPEEFRPFLDELFLIHLRKMQREPRDVATQPGAGPTERGTAVAGLSRPSEEADDDVPVLLPEAPADRVQDRPKPDQDPGPPSPPQATRPIALRPETAANGAPSPKLRGAANGGASSATEGHGQPPEAASGAAADRMGRRDNGRSGDQRLLSVLSTLELTDFPKAPQRLRIDPDEAMARLSRGDWIELIGRDGLPQQVKVAWINARRTVVLMVRRPDRRALSLRADELLQRFAQDKAALIV